MSTVDVPSTVDVSISGSTVVVYTCTLSFSVNCGNVMSGMYSVVTLSVVAFTSTRFTVVGRLSGTKSILPVVLVGMVGASLM